MRRQSSRLLAKWLGDPVTDSSDDEESGGDAARARRISPTAAPAAAAPARISPCCSGSGASHTTPLKRERSGQPAADGRPAYVPSVSPLDAELYLTRNSAACSMLSADQSPEIVASEQPASMNAVVNTI